MYLLERCCCVVPHTPPKLRAHLRFCLLADARQSRARFRMAMHIFLIVHTMGHHTPHSRECVVMVVPFRCVQCPASRRCVIERRDGRVLRLFCIQICVKKCSWLSSARTQAVIIRKLCTPSYGCCVKLPIHASAHARTSVQKLRPRQSASSVRRRDRINCIMCIELDLLKRSRLKRAARPPPPPLS